MPTIAASSKEKRLFSELFNDGDTKSKKQRVRFDDNVEVLTEEDEESEDEEEDSVDNEDEDVEFVLSIGEDGDIDYTIITTTSATASSSSASCSRDSPTYQEHKESPSSPSHNHLHHKISRPASPFAGSDRRLCEELYMSPSSYYEGTTTGGCDDSFPLTGMMASFAYANSPSRSSACWSSSLGNNLKILVPSQDEKGAVGGRKVSFDFKAGGAQSPGAAAAPHHYDDETAILTPLITPPSSPRRVVYNISSDNGKVTEEEAVICEWPCNLTVDNAITSALELPL